MHRPFPPDERTTDQLVSRRQLLVGFVVIPGTALLGSSACAAQAGVSVQDFGAVGDGRSDDTRAFQSALATGQDVFVPAAAGFYRISRTLALSRPGQQVLGSGVRSRVIQSGSGANSDVFITTHDGCGFQSLSLTPGTRTRALSNGWGIVVSGARRCSVRNCHFSGMRRGGVLLSDSEDCQVAGNTFVESVVRGDGSERQSETGYDIFLMGSAHRHLVSDNRCESGVGVGIGCQTVERGKSQSGNIIRSNTVRQQPAYGIMLYLSHPADSIQQVTIENNSIDMISGSIRTDDRTLFYGCGIYVASSNNFVVRGNQVSRTNVDRRLPFSGSAVPAGIGLSGFGNGTVSNNVIDGCYDGIASIQATEPQLPTDRTLIADNIVRACDHTGILLLDSVGATVRGNRMESRSRAGQGVYAARVAARHAGTLVIDGNEIINFGVGVEVQDRVPSAEIIANSIRGNSGNGIYCSADSIRIQQNRINGTNGIAIPPTAGRGLCSDNVIAASREAVLDGSRGAVQMRNNTVISGR